MHKLTKSSKTANSNKSSAIYHKLINTQDRKYQKIIGEVKRFIRKNKKIDHLTILNSLKIDYDTLMRVLNELKSKGNLK
ncbi:MAG TPA: hypothetical protein VFY55_02870 [Nitrososphaeraceae archaeon]|nr:hypothetical protein [Nitrososphaeraceae archaeon]